MTKIAIIGNEGSDIIKKALIDVLKIAGLKVFSYEDTKYGTFKQLANDSADVFIAPVSLYLLEHKKSSIDVLIFECGAEIQKGSLLNLINEDALIIVDSDDKQIYKYLLGSKANLLTYGFNSKASVTASSILESMDKTFLQICIQRSFKTINGGVIEAQEIPITLSSSIEEKLYAKEGKKDDTQEGRQSSDAVILNQIAAVTAALYLGIHTKTIALFASR